MKVIELETSTGTVAVLLDTACKRIEDDFAFYIQCIAKQACTTVQLIEAIREQSELWKDSEACRIAYKVK